MMTNYREEETLLKPCETTVSFEAKIIDSKFIASPNSYGEYRVTLFLNTINDSQTFFEAAENALSIVEMTKSSYSQKQAHNQYEDKYGYVIANQLFKPKLNLELYHDMMYVGKDASVKGHFRDLANGAVVFQADYIDFYQDDEPAEHSYVDAKDDDDDDW